MVTRSLDRRAVLTGLAAATALLPQNVLAKEIIDLNWTDLIPEGQPVIPPALRNLLQHDESAPASQQPQSMGVRTDWNNRTVRLPGFIIPLDYSGKGITAFILAPFVGACIHVPPPPANQLVFVTSETPYSGKGMFEAVKVVGELSVSSISTHLADVGYALTADRIEPYEV
ncbi:DUF3299 domain-containing protein [Planktotalea sp.]|uniref:DUF3299 domain-containing protein n=1 Tax=Planktotalea sp. TaxID=2029877 RepID=UPI003D6B769D